MKPSSSFSRRLSARFAPWTLVALLALPAAVRAANPSLTGTLNNIRVTDAQSTNLFSAANVSAGDTNVLTVFVDFAPTNYGSLNPLPPGVVQNGTNYLIAATNAANAETILQSLVFTPVPNFIPVPDFSNVVFHAYIVDAVPDTSTVRTTTVRVTATNNAPTLTPGAPFTYNITDKTNTLVFTNVTIADVDDGGDQPLTVRVTLDAIAKGTFTSLGGFVATSSNYTFTGTAADATTALRQLVFVPTPNRVLPGTSETTTFTLAVLDSFAAPVTSSAYSVTALSINDAPTLTALAPFTNSITDKTTNTLAFTNVTIADVDLSGAQPLVVTIALNDTNNGTFAPLTSFTNVGANYVFTGTPAAATTAIRALRFIPTPNHVPVDASETTTFTLTVSDTNAPPVTNTAYSVTALSINDAPQMTGLTTTHLQVETARSGAPFSVITLLDVDRNPDTNQPSGEDLSWSVTLTGIGNLELNGVNLGSTYSSTNAPAGATLSLRALLYRAPTFPVETTNTVTLNITVGDGHAATISSNVFVDVYSLIVPPGLSGMQSGQIVNDNTTIAPFSKVNVSSGNGSPVTVTVSLAGVTNDVSGQLINLGGFVRSTPVGSTSLYQMSGNTEAVTAAIRALLFQPVPNRINGSSNEVVTFRIALLDSGATNAPVSDTTTTVIVVPVNDVPVIAGVSPLVTIQDNETLPPFPTVLITDADELGLQPITATITLDVAAKGAFTTNSLIASGFISNSGSYTFTGAASNLTARIRQLVFIPTPGRVAVGLTEITTFNLNLNDTHGGIVANAGTSIRVASVSGGPFIYGASVTPPVSIPLGTNVYPFELVSVADPGPLSLNVRINDLAQGAFTTNSVLASGFTNRGGGIYFISGYASNINTALALLDFAPAPALPLGATINFTISVTNSLPNYLTVGHAIVLRTVQNCFIVTKLTDYDPASVSVPLSQKQGTLRKAIADAKNNDHITFDIRSALPGQPDYPAVIRLVAPLDLDNNLTFDGPGAERLTISGDSDGNGTPDVGLFNINAQVVMNRLAFTKGYASSEGGAFYVSENGGLTLSYCSVTESTAEVWGGGISVNHGSLAMDHCLVASNRTSTALGQGGGGIALWTFWPCTIVHTTFATNRQEAIGGLGGGALYAETADAGIEFPVDLLNCTFRDNRDAANHGSAIRPNVFNTLVQLQNSIVADGQGKNIEMDESGDVISLGGNISDDATASIFSAGGVATNTFIFQAVGDRVNATNLLAGLAANGGPTLTHALTTNSLAIGNAVSNVPTAAFYSTLGTDQRGYFRDASPDSGAFERGASQRMIIEELHFNPAAPNTNNEFIEFYVPRDSTALNVAGFKVLVDGVLRHSFTNQPMEPGEALVLFSAGHTSTGVPTGVRSQIAAGNLNLDNASGKITLQNANGQELFTVNYVGAYTSTDPNDYGFLAANNQSLVLSPQFQGVFLPYQRVVASVGGSNTNGLSNPGYDAAGAPLAIGNAPPFAYDDLVATDAHTVLTAVNVLGNDTDLDATDVIRVVATGISTNAGVYSVTNYSLLGALLTINVSPTAGASISYDPTASAFITALPQGSNVVDSFQYTILDSSNGVDNVRGSTAPEILQNFVKATATVTVNVVGVNSAPTPQPDSVATRTNLTTPEDVLLDFTTAPNLLANDTDPNSDDNGTTLNIIAIGATNGYVSNRLAIVTALGATATLDIRFDRNETHITYDPRASATLNALAFGTTTNDTFYYSVKDSYGVVSTAPVSVEVTGVNDRPTANPNAFATDEDTAVAVSTASLLANDTDPDNGYVLTLSLPANVSALGASVTISGTNVIYDPTVSTNLNSLANKEFATDTFTYTATDEFGLASNAVVTVTVAGVNDKPISAPDAYATTEDAAFTTNAPGVLANDIEPDINGLVPDDSFRVIPATNVTAAGVPVVLSETGSFSYDPRGVFDWLKQGQNTNESFSYVVMDHSLSLANDDNFAVTATTTNTILPVLANDVVLSAAGGAFTITSVTTPNHGGSVNIISNALSYTPLADYVGAETFTYAVADGLGGSDTATVTVTLTGSRLHANADAFRVARGTTNIFDVLPNDRILPATGAALSITSLGTPSFGGTVSLNGTGPNNSINYVPNPANFSSGETFTYTVTSGSLVATGTVSVVFINRTNELTANPDYFTVIANGGNNPLDVLANDLILPGPNTNLVITGFTSNSVAGTVSLNAARNRLIYKPAPGISNQFEPAITYSISDNAGGTYFASVLVRVVPSGLIAGDDTFVVMKNSTNTLPVMVNDVVLPNLGQTLFISGTGFGSNAPSQGGSLAINGPGTGLVYSPAANFTGSETFTYEISDGSPARGLGRVTVVVLDNSPATSNPDAYRVARESANNVLPVLANDYTLPKTPGAYTITGLLTNGLTATVSINGAAANNTLLYTPAPGFIGTDRFSYICTDTFGNKGTNLVAVTVGDLAPRADSFSVLSDTAANELDVRANDLAYPDATSVRAIHLVGATDQGGSVTTNAAATAVLYTPAPGFTGVEHFTYTLKDDSTNLFPATATVRVYARGSDRDTNTVTLTVLGVNDLPTVAGNTNYAITDKQTVQPFAAVTVTDLDEHGLQPLTARIAMDHLDNGGLQSLGGFTQTAPGRFTFYGTPAAITTALRGIVFAPVPNHIRVPTTETTSLTLSLDDSYVVTPVTNLTQVAVTAVNDAPVITGTVAGQTVYSQSSIKPFVRALITEVDNDRTQALRITVTLDNAAKGTLSSLGGFSALGGGVYSYGVSNGTVTAAQATTALRGLVFTPTVANRVAPGTNETTQFTIRVDDFFAPTVVDANTTVVAIHPLTAKVTANDKAANAQFGWSVATTRDLAVVGAPNDPANTNSGAVYLYARSLEGSNNWTQIKKLLPLDGHAANKFGTAVAIADDLVVVGASGVDSAGKTDNGAVYIFNRNQGGTDQWGFVTQVLAPDRGDFDYFGSAVAISGNTIVVGAYGVDLTNVFNYGAAYVFDRNPGNSNQWDFVKKLLVADRASFDELGTSVAISGDRVVLGAPLSEAGGTDRGAAYIFARHQGGTNFWGQVAKLTAADGANSDSFGASVSMSGDNLVVGAPLANAGGPDRGAAYVFTRNPAGTNQWDQIAKLGAADAADFNRFGSAVSIDGTAVVVGAPAADGVGGVDYGTAYLFRQNHGGSNVWGQVDKFLPATVGVTDNFGGAVAVFRNTVVVGAYNGLDSGIRSGTAFMFRLKYNNAPLVVTPLADQTVTPSTPLNYTVPAETFADADADDSLTLGLDGSAPGWLNFVPATGAFSGTPNVIGDYPVMVRATDSDGASATNGFTIHVTAVPNVFSSLSIGSLLFGEDQYVVVTLNGVANTNYRLLRTTSMSAPVVWTEAASGTADAGGVIVFYDLNPVSPVFYRAVSP